MRPWPLHDPLSLAPLLRLSRSAYLMDQAAQIQHLQQQIEVMQSNSGAAYQAATAKVRALVRGGGGGVGVKDYGRGRAARVQAAVRSFGTSAATVRCSAAFPPALHPIRRAVASPQIGELEGAVLGLQSQLRDSSAQCLELQVRPAGSPASCPVCVGTLAGQH